MEENKLYIKVGTFEEKDENDNVINIIENCILGYFICFAKTPKYRATGCNFDESKDFENAIVVDSNLLNTIEVNKTQFIDGKVVQYEYI